MRLAAIYDTGREEGREEERKEGRKEGVQLGEDNVSQRIARGLFDLDIP